MATTICSLGHGLHTFIAVPRSTQPCIPPGSLDRVPASAGVKARMLPSSAGWQVTLLDPIWHVSSHSGVAMYNANCYIRVTLLYFT